MNTATARDGRQPFPTTDLAALQQVRLGVSGK
jgi:hypothetical protein